MPRRKEHFRTGALFGGGFATLSAFQSGNASDKFPEIIGGVFGGMLGGCLPDILEPSKGNPNHRGFCHSRSAGGGMFMSIPTVYGFQEALRVDANALAAERAHYAPGSPEATQLQLKEIGCRLFAGFLAVVVWSKVRCER